MKNKTLLLTLLLSVRLFAQNSLPEGITVPDYAGDMVAYDTASKQSLRLEKQRANVFVSTKAYSATKQGKSVDGERSPVRIGAGQAIRFFIKWQAPGGVEVNPADVICMGKFEVRKGKRTVTTLTSKSGFMSLKRETSGNQDYKIGIEFRKTERDLVEIIISGNLPEGEYFFGTEYGIEMACFGVDASK